ncbi:S41 family peptidase [Patescibacteria group bacterium]|nr:S41 family peptidase [Patescibacteria group bacterium]
MKNKVLFVQVAVISLIAFFGGYYFGVNKVAVDWKNYKPQVTVTGKEPPPGVTNIDFTQFWTVWQKVEAGYYDKSKIDGKKMVNGAIAGALQSLDDPFTVYLPPVQNDNFKQGLAGQFTGIGAELSMKDKDIIVVAPLGGSPAEKAGVKAGDVILKVDGAATSTWTLAQTVEKIRGPKGTNVIISVLHKEGNKIVDIKITRDVITVKSVDGWVKKTKDIDSISKFKSDDTIAYIRLTQFGDSTNKDWTALINKLNEKIKREKNFKGVILDLRNNPGGYLTDAVFIASEFVPQGSPVVYEENAAEQKGLTAARRGAMVDYPVVVLINRGSASASEIVSGALRDLKKIKLIGETSFGKGTVQQAEDLGGGSGIHITVAKWLTPNKTWVNGKGLKPDIEVQLDPKDPSRDAQLEKAIEELIK